MITLLSRDTIVQIRDAYYQGFIQTLYSEHPKGIKKLGRGSHSSQV